MSSAFQCRMYVYLFHFFYWKWCLPFIPFNIARSFIRLYFCFLCAFVSLSHSPLYSMLQRDTTTPIPNKRFNFILVRMRRSYVWTTDTWTLRCVWVRSFVMIMVLVCSFEFRLYNYISGMLSLVVRTICIYIYTVLFTLLIVSLLFYNHIILQA